MAWRAVTAKPWQLIKAQLPKPKRPRTAGRPPLDDRKCFEGIFWFSTNLGMISSLCSLAPAVSLDFCAPAVKSYSCNRAIPDKSKSSWARVASAHRTLGEISKWLTQTTS